MVALSLVGVSKRFGDQPVIHDFSAEVDDGEFLVLLGPSGCGKSTMLRMIAGLTDISSGVLSFGGDQVNELTPKQRNVAFVFQSYALYPHMSVRENIAFPLIMDRFRWWHHLPIVDRLVRRRLARQADIADEVERTAELLELTAYLDRRPKALSGGQRQRVAVARSIVRDPAVYLFDEPLSNLDAKLRMQMRGELSALYERVRKTFVYVTHDQVEAMTMATRIIVMDAGRIQQHGTPKEIYAAPANTFVARFIGSPPMNIGEVRLDGEAVQIMGADVGPASRIRDRLLALGIDGAAFGVRAEHLHLADVDADADADAVTLDAMVVAVEDLGAESVIGVVPGPPREGGVLGAARGRHGLMYARVPGESALVPGAPCRVSFSPEDVHLFDTESGVRLESPRGPV